MAAGTQRWMKFWPQDWEADECLKVCSLAARGLWASMICLMHKADPYGHLIVNGKTPDAKRLAAVIGSTTEKEVAALIKELESEGVFSRTDEGVIFSRRMVRDKQRSEEGALFGARGGNPTLTRMDKGEGLTPPDKAPGRVADKAGGGGGLTDGVGPTRAREAEAESESKQPLARVFGGKEEHITICPQTKKRVCNGWFIDEVMDRVYVAARINDAVWTGRNGAVQDWLVTGYEPDAFIPIIRDIAARRDYSPPQTLNYFTTPIEKALGKAPRDPFQVTPETRRPRLVSG